MSILCCHVPHFLYTVACQEQPALKGRPTALLGPDGEVWALSLEAAGAGLYTGMRAQQARTRCPDVTLSALNLSTMQTMQQGLLQVLAELELPTEPVGWGTAYLNLQPVTPNKAEVIGLAGDLGRQIRRRFGSALQPALGWDSGKFTARAAALRTVPGRMRLVAATDEARFLAPLPITLLPLPSATLEQLGWLGIRTLGQFGALPSTAVWQRFGQTGKLAQQWARGQDRRPVCHGLPGITVAEALDWDPPIERIPPVLAALQAQLAIRLARLRAQLQGCLGLLLTLQFADGSVRAVNLRLMQPTTDPEKLLWQIEQQFTALIWPAALTSLDLVLEPGELPIQQLSLFSEMTTSPQSMAQLATQLTTRHGPIFFKSALVEAAHPVAARRSQRQRLA